jgi:hypothetical protein
MTSPTQYCPAALMLSICLYASPPQTPTRHAAPQSSSSEGLRLLRKMQEALGGAQRIAAVRDVEEIVRAEARDANGSALGEVRKRTRWIRNPNLLRVDQIGPRGTYVLYLDGGSDSGWEILPDLQSADRFKTTGKAIELAGGELDFARGYLSAFDLTMWLADQTPGYSVTSPRPNVLRIAHHGNATDFTIDDATWLPIKSAGVSLADPDHPVPAEMHYEGWKEFSGVRFPTHRVNYHSGVNRGEVTTETIRVNSGLVPKDLAAKPADFAPEIPRR